MYNVPWQNGRMFQTPVGVLTASFLLRPNTMFHPEGEWSVRLILPPIQALRLRQMVMPAHDDVVTRAKEMHRALPSEQQARRPFKENSFWQAASTDGGLATENIYFTFRLPTIDRTASLQAASIGDLLNKPHHLAAVPNTPMKALAAASKQKSKDTAEKPRRKRKVAVAIVEPQAIAPTSNRPTSIQPVAEAVLPKPVEETATHVALSDAQGQALTGLTLEPDHWDAVVSFSIQQYWLRSFGAGVTLRLHGVQLLGLHHRPHENGGEVELPLSIAL